MQKAFPGWQARPVEEALDDTLQVLRSNLTGYYARTGEPAPTRENLLEDCGALPPGRSLADKAFLLLYRQGEPVSAQGAVPTRGETAAMSGPVSLGGSREQKIGFLWMPLPPRGIGLLFTRALNADWERALPARLELGCYETNNPSLTFWRKMGFTEIRRTFRKGADGKERALLSLAKSLDKNF